MAAKQTFGLQMRRRARALYDEGHGCNSIARQLAVSAYTISKWAKAEGLSFGREQTAIAVRANTIDLRFQAQLLAQKLSAAADALLETLDQPYTHRELGGKFRDEYVALELDAPPVEVTQKIAVIAAVAIDKALKVSTALDEGSDLPAVDKWLEHMTGAA